MRLHFSMAVVIAVISYNFWFTDRVLTIFEKTGVEPVVLIGSVFAFTTGELWSLSKIKREEIKKEGEKNDNDG